MGPFCPLPSGLFAMTWAPGKLGGTEVGLRGSRSTRLSPARTRAAVESVGYLPASWSQRLGGSTGRERSGLSGVRLLGSRDGVTTQGPERIGIGPEKVPGGGGNDGKRDIAIRRVAAPGGAADSSSSHRPAPQVPNPQVAMTWWQGFPQ